MFRLRVSVGVAVRVSARVRVRLMIGVKNRARHRVRNTVRNRVRVWKRAMVFTSRELGLISRFASLREKNLSARPES